MLRCMYNGSSMTISRLIRPRSTTDKHTENGLCIKQKLPTGTKPRLVVPEVQNLDPLYVRNALSSRRAFQLLHPLTPVVTFLCTTGFKIPKLYIQPIPPTKLCNIHGSQNKQRSFPYTTWTLEL